MRIFQKISLVKLQGAQQATYCNCFTAIFCNKNSFPKSQKNKNFRQQGNFRQQKNEEKNLKSKEL